MSRHCHFEYLAIGVACAVAPRNASADDTQCSIACCGISLDSVFPFKIHQHKSPGPAVVLDFVVYYAEREGVSVFLNV